MNSIGKDQTSRQIKSTAKACKILKYIHKQEGAKISEIVESVGLSKGTIHTHLATLVEENFVVKTANEYRASLKFLEIGEDLKRNHSLYQCDKNELAELAKEEHARTQLVVEEFGHAVALHTEQGPQSVAPPIKVGKRGYLHTNASGKCILAHLSDDYLAEILERHGLPQQTENTITDIDALEEELASISESGIAFNDEENMRGLRAVGAPILDERETVQGAVSISGPVNGLSGERFRKDLPAKISNIANRIELEINVNSFETR